MAFGWKSPLSTCVDIPFRRWLLSTINKSEEDIQTGRSGPGQFNTTHWSVVLLAGEVENSKAAAALESLCGSYWYPLYAYVRRKGYSAHDAQDLTQDFFARLLEKNYFQLAARERGRFRSFLLKSLNHFLVNDWVRNRAQKRGAGQKLVSFDEETAERLYQREPLEQPQAESLYDKKWALALLEAGLRRLAQEYSKTGKDKVFEQLKGLILSETSGDTYRTSAVSLGMSEGAVKVALHRLRGRFRSCVRDEVAQTVATPGEVEEELRFLMSALNV